MSTWPEGLLDRIAGSEELEMAPVRRSGELRRPTPIWAVQADGALYVRAAYPERSSWWDVARASRRAHVRAGQVALDVTIDDASTDVLDRVDAAYREKYARYASIVDSITDAEHRATTLRLLPAESA